MEEQNKTEVSVKQKLQKSPTDRKNLRLALGSDEAQIKRANQIYLNQSGPGSYEVRSMFSQKVVTSNQPNVPSYTMRNKVKGGYSIDVASDYRGRNSPSVTHYSPNHMLGKSSSRSMIMAKAPKHQTNSTMDHLRASLPI
jgi:hypothetical protein